MVRAKVKITAGSQYGDFKAGEVGWIDGYVRGGQGTPLAAVIMADGRVELVEIYKLMVLNMCKMEE